MKQFIFICALLVLTGCNSGGGGGDSTPSKSLFSIWTSEDQSFTMDIRDAEFDTPFVMLFAFSSGEVCSCDFTITGSESSGAAAPSNCAYQGGGGGDPDCVALFGNGGTDYTYTKSGNTLTLCDAPSVCADYY